MGSQPAVIDCTEIDAIKRVAASPLLTEPYADVVPGEIVTMSDGPLKGLNGTLMEVRKGLRLVISVQLLRRSVLIEIDRDWVVSSRLRKLPSAELPSANLGLRTA
jgi:transcription antitermination factor NusG